MPLGTMPVPLQSGQAMPSWATIALRMKALLFGSLFRKSASSSSTLKATICDFGALRVINRLAGGAAGYLSSVRVGARKSQFGPREGVPTDFGEPAASAAGLRFTRQLTLPV